MKALWLCNTLLPPVACGLGETQPVVGGWVCGQRNALKERCPELDITLVCPYAAETSGTADGLTYYTFVSKDKTRYNPRLKSYFAAILRETKPDVIQLWGCEYPHAWSMLEAAMECGLQERTLLHVQGLLHVYERHYYGTMDFWSRYGLSLRDLLTADNVALSRWHARRRGEYEKRVIRAVAAVAGRTEWDHACVARIRPDANYFFCRETLRDAFYQPGWSLERCRRQTIFFSQPDRCVKAFYQLLRVLPRICAHYPNARILTTGELLPKGWKSRLRQSWYAKTLSNRIAKLGLKDRVESRGNMDEWQVRQAMLEANVFVSCSSIENSPNSLGESMLLGVPCVASDVGGVAERMAHGFEGFVYPFDEKYMLEWYIEKLFEDDDLCRRFSSAASSRASEQHDRAKSADELMEIYRMLCQGRKGADA